jgi:ribosomal protein S18 acetylase RimI-like enzyme
MMSPGDGDVRLRRRLEGALDEPVWPSGHVMRTLAPGDERDLHALLFEVFGPEMDASFDEWWAGRSGDDEFDPGLCFLVFDPAGRLVAAACCWTSGFLKDLAVHPAARRRGLGEALVRQVFVAFRVRGIGHVDLKTNRIENADAMRLYQRLGMVEVGWEG